MINFIIKQNKAAMFGLDARIALAIFASLSVIAGASLYSVIREARITTTYYDLKEVVKASEAYLLDNSELIPINPDSPTAQLCLGDLVENRRNLTTWRGPYLSLGVWDKTVLWFRYKGTGHALALKRRDGATWTADLAAYPRPCSSALGGCYEWLNLQVDGISDDLFTEFDTKFDNSDGPHTGNIRYREFSPTSHVLYIKGVKRGIKDEF
jgi:hypothetical protein